MPFFPTDIDPLAGDAYKRLYNSLAKIYHPDKPGGNEDEFKKLSAEWEEVQERLKTPRKRRRDQGEEKQAPEEKEERQEPIVCYEKYDLKALKAINHLDLEATRLELMDNVWKLVKDFNSLGRTARTVVYKPGAFKKGRLYADGLSLQTLPKWVRCLVANKYDHDLDMKRAAPTIMSQVFEKVLGSCGPLLKRYVVDTAPFYTEVQEVLPQASNSALKQVFHACANGGSYKNALKEVGLPAAEVPILAEWQAEWRDYGNQLKDHADCQELTEFAEQEAKKDGKLAFGKFMAYAYQQEERKVLLVMRRFLGKQGYQVSGLIHDGLHATRKHASDPFPEHLLRDMEADIKTETGFEVVIAEKSLEPTAEMKEMLWGPVSELRMPQGDYLRQLLVLEGRRRGYMRGASQVWGPHEIIPGAMVKVMDAEKFINDTLKRESGFKNNKLEDLLKWFNTQDLEIPYAGSAFVRITKDTFANVASFKNGYLDLDTLLLCKWDKCYHVCKCPCTICKKDECRCLREKHQEGCHQPQSHRHSPPCTNLYFDQEIDHYNFNSSDEMGSRTPLWDALLSSHWPDKEVRETIEVLLGRCLYPVGKYDHWEVMLFLLGKAGAGKSTIVALVNGWYPEGTVATITQTFEQKFGLSALCDKRLISIMDVPRNFENLVNQQDFQSMITGEKVSVAIKYKAAECTQNWSVPAICAGNRLFNYADAKGSIARRLVVVECNANVSEDARDTNLLQKIKATELPYILIRAANLYRQKVVEVGDRGFWDFCPVYFNQRRQKTMEEMNSVIKFTNENAEKVTDHCTLWSTFKKKLEAKKIDEDDDAIKDALGKKGFVYVKGQNLCKHCWQLPLPFNNEECYRRDVHGQQSHRGKKDVILHMKLLSE
jgi:hypothetical protein